MLKKRVSSIIYFLDDWHFQAAAIKQHKWKSDGSGESFVSDNTRRKTMS